MWPDPGEALSRTIDAEQAISDLYAEALRRWAPDARDVVLPTLADKATNGDPVVAATLPPDPDAVGQTQSRWDALADRLILSGLAMLWSVTYTAARNALGGQELPAPAEPDVDADPAVVAIIAAASGVSAASVRDSTARAAGIPSLREAVSDFVEARRPAVSAALGAVRDKLTVRLSKVPATEPDRTTVLRETALEVLDAGSPELRDVARQEGYQAAGVMNHAVVEAARGSDEELQKTWICTIDAKTRPTHWAADGQRVPLDGKFTIGGEQLAYPGDESAHPREWKNCRCRVGVLAPDEALPDEVDRHTERLGGRDSVAINRHGRTQAEEIERRREAGNVRARDDEDGIGRVTAAGWAAPSEQEMSMAEDQGTETFLTWSGYIGKLGVPTSDRRILAADIDLAMREFPLPMAWQKQAVGGHMDSFTVGVVEEAKIDGDRVWARGYFLNDVGDDTICLEAIDKVHHKVSAPSLDLGAAEYLYTDENGKEIEGDLFDWWEENGEPYAYFTKAEVTGFTLVQTPAFDGIDIELGERETRDLAVVASIIASVDGPRLATYDPALFEDPKLPRPTAPTMDNKTGRVYGHLAEWGHTIRGGRELTPRNSNGYLNFHTSQVLLENGKQLSVGRLTVQGGHADTSPGVTLATARAHYDNVCTAFALVRVGEDEHGIWFSGVPAPGVDPEVFQAGMTAPLSGDWRDCGFGLDMIGAHAVNSPGFPIYSAVTGPDGQDVALVASLGPSRRSRRTDGGFTLDRDSIKTLLVEVVETLDQRRADQQAALAARSRTQSALARARETVGDPPAEPSHTERVAALLERI
ncbi:hypothetical protein [Mycolicibacterium sp.]|uniref:hypothetical protein n=1 Tax=Mycolicibacterium sp. TaxID=2320850 RepID=UPI00355EE08E